MPFSPSAFDLSQHQIFSNKLPVCIKGPKYQKFSFSISHSVNTQGWSPLRLTGLISLLSKGLSGVFSCTAVQRNRFFGVLPSLWRSSHNLYMTTGKTIALTIWTFVGRVISVCNQLQLQNYICCLSWMFPGLTSIWLTLYFLLSWTSAYTMAPLSVHMKYKE